MFLLSVCVHVCICVCVHACTRGSICIAEGFLSTGVLVKVWMVNSEFDFKSKWPVSSSLQNKPQEYMNGLHIPAV